MQIDPNSRVVRFSDEVSTAQPKVEYFEQMMQEFRGQIRSFVYRMIPVGDRQPLIRAEEFSLDPNSIVSQRRKFQVLFSASGTPLVAETIYQYRQAGYGGGTIGFRVRAMATMHPEIPRTVQELPFSARPLDAITIIRISQLRGIDVAAIATYNKAGELFSVVVDPLKSADHLPTSAQAQTVDEVIQESLHQFGFPLRILADDFQPNPTPLYERSNAVAPFTIVSFHYARNRWVQQYIFAPSIPWSQHEVRLLEFQYTAQDDSLQFVDETLPWGPAESQRMSFPKR